MFKAVVIIFLCFSWTLARDPAFDMANNIYHSFSNFLTVEETAKLVNAITAQICQGKSVREIHRSIVPTITKSIGGDKAFKALELQRKLKQDLGADYEPVHEAISRMNEDFLGALLADTIKNCELPLFKLPTPT
ncbi:hypothetical protein L596_030565 [Steinernema carpocapsae]|uniref:Uncharacterized protein n=1 Tax=Steinernema carpocapsae TaxID=34508 RepID=A0A4V5ZWZ8_STECR|nr:hypothetical protein L596_030565 [Steinernema carpocapsae]